MTKDLLSSKLRPLFYTLFTSALGSTLITTVYSTVDIICVGHHSGPQATAALSCLNPLWSMMFAPGLLVGIGGSVMMSNRKASGKTDAANAYFTLSVIIAAIFSVMVSLSFILFPRELITFFGAESEEVLNYGVTYMRPVGFASSTFTMCACLATFMRNDGEAFTPTVATAIGGVINIFLDVFFVFTLDLGVFGAGLATSIGQAVAFLIILIYFFRKKCTLRFTNIHRTSKKFASIFTLGSSAFVLELAFAVTVTVFNRIIVSSFGENHLAVYGTVATLSIMYFCLFNAIGTALQPLASSAFGAGMTERVREVLRLSLRLAVVFGAVFLLLSHVFPETILRMYMDVNDEVLAIGPRIVRIYTVAIAATGISIVSTFYFQAVLRRLFSLIISVLRALVLPIAFAFIIPAAFGIDALWWSFPTAEALTFVSAVIMLVYDKRRGDKLSEQDKSDAEPESCLPLQAKE